MNETNGVTPRRWVLGCNPGLAALITDAIGDAWVGDAGAARRARPHLDDPGFLDRFARRKRANKAQLSDWLKTAHGFAADPDAMFDIQIKRIHEYKRQHLNILEAIALWQEIRDNPGAGWVPRVKIFGGQGRAGLRLRQGDHPARQRRGGEDQRRPGDLAVPQDHLPFRTTTSASPRS